ncbi:MAG TPA: 16S rRNA (cytidine(1402)-2'-O)-methyltransferase, partial [Candidatus Kapabacteria bacterium]|nr:16S rRNA (cytidine(1402)-2'-O)-methyltransferase [Candidatus Kapabacteria bacterium]
MNDTHTQNDASGKTIESQGEQTNDADNRQPSMEPEHTEQNGGATGADTEGSGHPEAGSESDASADAATEDAAIDETGTDVIVTEEIAAEDAAADETATEGAVSDETIAGEAATEETAASESAPVQDADDEEESGTPEEGTGDPVADDAAADEEGAALPEDLVEHVEPAVPGHISLVGVPIGNRDDMTMRGLKTLQRADVVVCEEYKVGARLLRNYNITQRLLAMNEHNEEDASNEIIELLRAGKEVAVISDAGLPLLADPGHILMRKLQALNVQPKIVPGVSSVMTGLMASGFGMEQFEFVGFLPRKPEERRNAAQELAAHHATVVILETPYRLRSLLAALSDAMPSRRAAIAINLTTAYEAIVRGTLAELFGKFSDKRFKGEFVLVLDAWNPKEAIRREARLHKAQRAAEPREAAYGIGPDEAPDFERAFELEEELDLSPASHEEGDEERPSSGWFRPGTRGGEREEKEREAGQGWSPVRRAPAQGRRPGARGGFGGSRERSPGGRQGGPQRSAGPSKWGAGPSKGPSKWNAGGPRGERHENDRWERSGREHAGDDARRPAHDRWERNPQGEEKRPERDARSSGPRSSGPRTFGDRPERGARGFGGNRPGGSRSGAPRGGRPAFGSRDRSGGGRREEARGGGSRGGWGSRGDAPQGERPAQGEGSEQRSAWSPRGTGSGGRDARSGPPRGGAPRSGG